MNKKLIWVVISLLVVASMLSIFVVSCGEEEETTPPPTTPPPTTPAEEPEYGGTLTIRNFFIFPGSFDPTAGMGVGAGGMATTLMYEALAGIDFTLDPNIWAYQTGFTPLQYLKGVLVEDWEFTDATTITMHVRQGIHWQNRPPVNGREFTADDIVYNMNRAIGAGEFTAAGPIPMIASNFTAIEEAVATGNYTVEFKLKQPGVVGLYQLLGAMFTYAAPEWFEQADPTDPLATIGTGPWILTDFVGGTSMTYSANPDYWGYDERYPGNKLPYADTVVQVAIPDPATALAAMRTGQVDMWTDPMGCITWQSVESLLATDPDIQVAYQPRPASCLILRCDTEPFTDINVRKAFNMAIDRQSIAETFYGGLSNGNPAGIIGSAVMGWAVPYDEWPADLKAEYTYDVEGAQALLAETDWPTGFDTNVLASTDQSPDLLLLLKDELADIGVNMEINQMDPPTYQSMVVSGSQDQMIFSDGMAGLLWAPTTSLANYISSAIPQQNSTFNYDTTYDDMFAQIMAATTEEELQPLVADTFLYALSQHWIVPLVSSNTQCVVWQPYIKGYGAQVLASSDFAAAVRARVWIDSALKTSMGR